MRPYFRAMTEDVTITRFPTFADLLHYMDGSALPVGRAMCHILGVQSGRVTDAYPQADALSIAMQLSNFWRDIGQDWRLGRVYIPLEDLRRFGYSEADIADNQITPQLIELLEFEFARTETYYQQARAGLALLASGQWGVMSGLEIYQAILASIRRNRYDVFTRRAGASTARKLALVGWARWRSWS
jgi:phytoene synthase